MTQEEKLNVKYQADITSPCRKEYDELFMVLSKIVIA